MRTWIALLLLLLAPLAPASEKTDAAVTAGSRWLRQLDAKEFSAAYTGAGTLMRQAVSFEPWQAAIEKARTPLGLVHKRELIFGALEKEMPGLARGEYARLQFRTDFATQHGVVENLTLMLEDDGQWRPIGYHIQ